MSRQWKWCDTLHFPESNSEYFYTQFRSSIKPSRRVPENFENSASLIILVVLYIVPPCAWPTPHEAEIAHRSVLCGSNNTSHFTNALCRLNGLWGVCKSFWIFKSKTAASALSSNLLNWPKNIPYLHCSPRCSCPPPAPALPHHRPRSHAPCVLLYFILTFVFLMFFLSFTEFSND